LSGRPASDADEVNQVTERVFGLVFSIVESNNQVSVAFDHNCNLVHITIALPGVEQMKSGERPYRISELIWKIRTGWPRDELTTLANTAQISHLKAADGNAG
jgi:hypothetical protein